MAWFSYKCPKCGIFKKSLIKRYKEVMCPNCAETSKAVLKASSVQVIERLDNGAMARAVERLHNIEDIMEERDSKSTKEAMEKLGETYED